MRRSKGFTLLELVIVVVVFTRVCHFCTSNFRFF
ncbi:prepilin-type N-terminal cleavage/methylation domain-containing protein [Vibrio harveyi]|nr:prepilin-type N-terminal cleavage/methylation domain-containing protein [Vibrio harveyi]